MSSQTNSARLADEDAFDCCIGDPGSGHSIDCQNPDQEARCSECGRDYEGCECEESR